MEASSSHVPFNSPLSCLLNNLVPFNLVPDLKHHHLIFRCNQVWPMYDLKNLFIWLLNGMFDSDIIQDLYHFCLGKWKEIPYIQAFSYLHSKPSLYTLCSPAQVVLTSKAPTKRQKPLSSTFDPTDEPPPQNPSSVLASSALALTISSTSPPPRSPDIPRGASVSTWPLTVPSLTLSQVSCLSLSQNHSFPISTLALAPFAFSQTQSLF